MDGRLRGTNPPYNVPLAVQLSQLFSLKHCLNERGDEATQRPMILACGQPFSPPHLLYRDIALPAAAD
jgi:hypothetical protein